MRDVHTSAAALAAALALTAGFADGQSYLSWHLFGANMTGNTVLLGIAITKRSVAQAAAVLGPILAFISGCAIAQMLLGVSRQLCLGVEAALIVVAAFTEPYSWQLELIAVAMGVQNTAVKTFGSVKANTSFITGNYERLGQAFAHVVTGRAGAADRHTFIIVMPLVLSYALGAAIAGIFVILRVRHGLLFALPVIAVAAMLDRAKPVTAS